jgi:hypothetical protein
MIIKNTFQLFRKVGVGAYFLRCVNRCKEAQDMVVWLLAFQKSLCLIIRIHCCVTSLVVEFSIRVLLAITLKIDVKSHNQLQFRFIGADHFFKVNQQIIHGLKP